MIRVTCLCLVLLSTAAANAVELSNPGFEETDRHNKPLGWTILTSLDPVGYESTKGPGWTFDEVVPAQAWNGYKGSPRCLGFPEQGTWRSSVNGHVWHAPGDVGSGAQRAKAAAYQTVMVPAGAYRFTCWLRTADGAFWSGAFSLGIQQGEAKYAHDASTGIAWSSHNLAQKEAETGHPTKTGNWWLYKSPALTLDAAGPVTVWIRFNYINDNDMDTRWQADDAALEAVAGPPALPSPPTGDTYGEWVDVTAMVLVNPGFDEGPGDSSKGAFGWTSHNSIKLVPGYRGASLQLSRGKAAEQAFRKTYTGTRRSWRAELWSHSSAGARIEWIAQEPESNNTIATFAQPIPPSEQWLYCPLPEITVPGTGEYRMTMRILAPDRGMLELDSLHIEKDGRD